MKIIFALLGLLPCLVYSQALPLDLLKLPPGYHISIYAQNIPHARSMALGERGTVFVGTTADKVYAIVKQADATKTYTIATNLNHPNGVAFHDGALYVSETQRILRFANIEAN